MATLKYSIPGIGGSLGTCVICGKDFALEILLGRSVSSIKADHFDRDLPAHKICADEVIELKGPWKSVREKFPRGPMYDCLEEEFQGASPDDRKGL